MKKFIRSHKNANDEQKPQSRLFKQQEEDNFTNFYPLQQMAQSDEVYSLEGPISSHEKKLTNLLLFRPNTL